jgi:hypothetical protein
MVGSGISMGCVLFSCMGITKAVPVRVTVDVAEATVAVEVKVVMPAASPVFASPVADSISSGAEVEEEMVMPAAYPVLSSPAVGIVAPVSGAAQPAGIP